VAISKKNNRSKIMSHLTKTEPSLVIRLNNVTIVAQSVRLLPAHMCKDVHATRQLHCQWRSGQCHAKHAKNAASVYNTLDKIICYLQRIFNRNQTFKQQVSKWAKCIKIWCVFKNQCMWHFRLHFLPDMPKLELLTFAK